MTDADQDRAYCSHTELGQRCANLGTFSWSTHGSDRWFCRRHFFPLDPPYVFPRYESIAALPPEQKRHDGRDWARRILYRISVGEKLPVIAITNAKEALGIETTREPGSDDL